MRATPEWETLGGRLFRLARRKLNVLHDWARWNQQGRPTRGPVVIKRGTITKCRHGYALVSDWSWTFRYQLGGPIDADHMVDVLGAQYGVTRVASLGCCPKCQADGGDPADKDVEL